MTELEVKVLRPSFGPEEAANLAQSLFGVAGAVATELSGERDQTFELRTGENRRILKISAQSETRPALEFELGILRHIERIDPDLPVSRPIPCVHRAGDSEYIGVTHRGEAEHFVRMLTYRDGEMTSAGAELSDASIRDLGRSAARLGCAMRGFFHPAAGRTVIWNLAQIADVQTMVEWVDGESRRSLVTSAIEQFKERGLPQLPALRSQIMHGDLHLGNVLWDGNGSVSGILDFGDAVHGPLLLDVISPLADVMRRQKPNEGFRAARLFLDGYAAVTPLEPGEIELLGNTLSARLASMIAISSWQIKTQPGNVAYFEDLVDDSWQTLKLLDDVGLAEVGREFGVAKPRLSSRVLGEKRLRLFGPVLAKLFYEDPVHVAAAEGTWLIDDQGRRLLDAYNNVAVVGHCHPRVTQAVVDQTRKVNTHTRYLYEPLMDLAERLTDGMADKYGLDTVMVVNSGSEANDLTWRLARAHTGREGAIVSDFAYHGMTAAISDLSPQQWPKGYRARHTETFEVQNAEGGLRASVADGVATAIQRLCDRGIEPAALFIEGGFTNEGVLTPSREDVVAAVRIARAAGALIVADEVQVGHGRTGSNLWSFEGYGYTPDFVTMGKPMGNGYPVAALVTRADVVAGFRGGTFYFSTFGGNPVAARAAHTVLQVIEDERLLDNVARVSATLSTGLTQLATRNPAIGDIRHHGTLFGVQMAPSETASTTQNAESTVNALRRRGVLVGRTGREDDVLKIRPPLVFDEQNAALLLDALEDALSELAH